MIKVLNFVGSSLERYEFLIKNIFRAVVVYCLIEISGAIPGTWELEQGLSRIQQDISTISSNAEDISVKLDKLSSDVQAIN